MNLQPIVDYLEVQGFGTPGVDLFREEMPDSCDQGLLVTCMMPVMINHEITKLHAGAFQVIARDDDVDDARVLLNSVSNTLNVDGLTLDDMKFFFIRPRHTPLTYPSSEGGLIEASVNYDFRFVLI